ncbi:4Fe-4S binding protein [Planctomycetota bacterium]
MKRRIVQILTTIFTNLYPLGWFKGRIYDGPLKHACHPGMQCYSCPSATTACPLGALQNSLAAVKENLKQGQFNIGLYVIGFIGLLGMLFGRLVCGWLCPFGFLQELIYKIPTPKFRMPRLATYGRYVLLFVLVFLMPLAFSFANADGATYPWYCKLVCPVGTSEAGIAKIFSEANLSLGFFFRLKWVILIGFALWMTVTYRAFCSAGCPLGAIYGLFNRISVFRLNVDQDKCTTCKACQRACPLDIKTYETPNHADCIRCLKCVPACKFDALHTAFGKKVNRGDAEAQGEEGNKSPESGASDV